MRNMLKSGHTMVANDTPEMARYTVNNSVCLHRDHRTTGETTPPRHPPAGGPPRPAHAAPPPAYPFNATPECDASSTYRRPLKVTRCGRWAILT